MLKRRIGIIAVLMLLLAACNGEKAPPPTDIDPVAEVANAAQQVEQAKSFQMVVELSGTPVTFDASTFGLQDVVITLNRAEATYVAPEKIQGVVVLALDDLVAEVNMIAIDGDQFLNHQIITFGRWQEQILSPDFNPRSLGSGDDSIASALRAVQNLTYVGEETIDGTAVNHFSAQIPAERVKAVTVGLIGTDSGNVGAAIYLNKRDGSLRRLVIEEPTAPAPTIWTISFYEYNGNFSIERPEVEG